MPGPVAVAVAAAVAVAVPVAVPVAVGLAGYGCTELGRGGSIVSWADELADDGAKKHGVRLAAKRSEQQKRRSEQQTKRRRVKADTHTTARA